MRDLFKKLTEYCADMLKRRDPQKSHIFILIGITILIYANTLNNNFIWDDNIYIVNNKFFKSFKYLPDYFTSNFCAGVVDYPCSSFYRPVISIIHLIEYKIWGLRPFGWHLTSTIFHTAGTLMVYLTGLYIFRNSVTSLIAGLIFAVHPVHVESIGIAANITDAPTSIFYLLSFIFFIKYRMSDRKDIRHYSYLLIFFSLALLSKEMAVTLPIIIILYEFIFLKEKGLKGWIRKIYFYLPIFSILIIFLFIRGAVIGSSANGFSMGPHGLYGRILNIPYLITGYIKLLFFPINLNLLRPIPFAAGFLENRVYILTFLLMILIIGLIKIYKHSKEIVFLISWIIITITPVLNIIPMPYPAIVDRFAYLPSIGFSLLLGVVIHQIIQAEREKPLLKSSIYLLLTLYLSIYSFGTINRIHILKDDHTLWSDTVKKSPDSSIAHHNLAMSYENIGKIDSAINEYLEILRIQPDNYRIHNNLGVLFHKKGLIDLAVREYKEALKYNKSFDMAHINLGNAYFKQNLYDLAETEYREVLRINPDNKFSHFNLGNLYYKKGVNDMAIEEYRNALAIDPNYTDALKMLQKINSR